MNKLTKILTDNLEVRCGEKNKLIGADKCVKDLEALLESFAEYLKDYEPCKGGWWLRSSKNTFERQASEVSDKNIVKDFLNG